MLLRKWITFLSAPTSFVGALSLLLLSSCGPLGVRMESAMSLVGCYDLNRTVVHVAPVGDVCGTDASDNLYCAVSVTMELFNYKGRPVPTLDNTACGSIFLQVTPFDVTVAPIEFDSYVITATQTSAIYLLPVPAGFIVASSPPSGELEERLPADFLGSGIQFQVAVTETISGTATLGISAEPLEPCDDDTLDGLIGIGLGVDKQMDNMTGSIGLCDPIGGDGQGGVGLILLDAGDGIGVGGGNSVFLPPRPAGAVLVRRPILDEVEEVSEIENADSDEKEPTPDTGGGKDDKDDLKTGGAPKAGGK